MSVFPAVQKAEIQRVEVKGQCYEKVKKTSQQTDWVLCYVPLSQLHRKYR
jgi:hypothetical protein